MSGPELSEPPVSAARPWDRSRLPVVPRWVGLIALVVVLLGTSAWVIGQQFSSSATHHAPKDTLAPTSSYSRFQDPTATFRVGYPPTWKRVLTNNPQLVLLAEGPHGASFQVAETKITAPVDAANLASAKKLTERVVKEGPQVKLIPLRYHQPEEISLGDLPGYLYLYTFVDPTTGETGAHAHYFLFDGKTMITLVFQSLPSTNFVSLSPLFDRIASTFHALPAH